MTNGLLVLPYPTAKMARNIPRTVLEDIRRFQGIIKYCMLTGRDSVCPLC